MQRALATLVLVGLHLTAVFGQSDDLIKGTQQLLAKFQHGDMGAMSDLAAQMAALSEKEFGPRDPDHAFLVFFLAVAQMDQGRMHDAELNLQKALSIVKGAPSLLKHQEPYAGFIYMGFGRFHGQRGELGKAEQYLLESAKTLERVGGKDAAYALPINELGNFYKDQGNYAKAETYLYEAAEIRRKTLGENHFNYGVSLNNLASLYEQMGNYRAAAIYYEDSYGIWSKTLGPNHPLLATAFNNYAGLYVKTGSYNEAEQFYLKALSICQTVYGERHPYYTSTLANLGNLYRLMRQPAKAEQFGLKALELRPADQSVDHAYSMNNVALAKMDLGKLQDAENMLSQAMSIFKEQLGKNHKNVATCANNLGVINIKLDRPDKAAVYLKQSLGIALERIDYVFP
ncbi:MAG TPA: tetratricopeptide repeat protein, partial [Chryseosolibacter sp.]|nr:tetratricopeptide repeat protein [Chryseosolibacter sp.]